MRKDYFSHKAEIYDKDRDRVSNVDSIANTLLKAVALNPAMHLMDFGSGTGLLLERIAPHVNKITGVDVSVSMHEQLENKRDAIKCELDLLNIDLETTDLDRKFDGIISSMTMHHVRDIDSMFHKFYAALNDDGFIAISDLDEEDGSFHTEDTGVHHFGFCRDAIAEVAENALFRDISVIDASVMQKPHGDYPVFLLVARK